MYNTSQPAFFTSFDISHDHPGQAGFDDMQDMIEAFDRED